MNVSLLEQLFVVFGNQTDHVIVELFLLVHGDGHIRLSNSAEQPDVEKKHNFTTHIGMWKAEK